MIGFRELRYRRLGGDSISVEKVLAFTAKARLSNVRL